MQVIGNRERTTRRIATVGALLWSILAVGSMGLGEARATTMIRCSTTLGAGVVIDTEAEFTAAANNVRDGDCNEIDIAGDINFMAAPRSIVRNEDTTLTISGPSGRTPETRATLRNVGGGVMLGLGITVDSPGVADVEISNLNFEDFVGGDNYGGALSVTIPSTSTLKIQNASFIGNSARVGGALLSSGIVEIVDSTFEENDGTVFGGAISHGDDGSLTLTNVSFVDNTVIDGGFYGGAIYSQAPVHVVESEFVRNTSARGGAISAEDGSATAVVVSIVDSTFTDNIAGGDWGGAIHSEQVTVQGSTFVGNQALAGGAIRAEQVTTVDSIFERNVAEDGGGIQATESATVTGSTFRMNEAIMWNGGAVYAESLVVRRSSFVGNVAIAGGGAVFVSGATDIGNSTFRGNSAPSGGSLLIERTSAESSVVSFSTLVGPSSTIAYGSVINAGETTSLELVGSVLVGSSAVCRRFGADLDLNLSTSRRSFVSDNSCGGSAGSTTINTSYSTLSELGLSETLSTDVGAGKQVLALTSDSVLHSSVPLSLLPSGVTYDQLGLARFSSNGLTAAGALRGYTYVAPPAVPEVVPEIPVETVKPIVPIVPAVAVRSVVEDGREVIRGSSPANIGRRVKVMVRVRGTKRFVPAGFKVVNKAGRFRWSPSTGKEAEMYFVVGGVASDPVTLAKPRKP